MMLELLIVFLLHEQSGADINPLDKIYNVKVNEDVSIPWIYDYESDMFNVEWSFKNSSSTTVILTKVLTNPAQVQNSFNIQHDGNGNITLKKVTSENKGIYYCKVLYTQASARATVTGTATLDIIYNGTTTSSTSTAIPITSPTSTTTTHLVSPNTTSSTSTSTTTTATASISTSTTTTTSIKTATRTSNSTVPKQNEIQSEQDNSKIVVIVVPSVVGGLFVIGAAVTVSLVWKFRKNQTLHNNRSKHHTEGHSKKENKGRPIKCHPEYSEYIPSHHHGFSAKMYSGQSEIKRNPLYCHHLDRHMNMSYVSNRGEYCDDQLYNGNQFLVYQMPSAGADPLYTRRGHMIHPEHRYQYSTNPRATTLKTRDNTIMTDYSWNWN